MARVPCIGVNKLFEREFLALSAQNMIYAEEPAGQKKTEVEADLHLVEATITLSFCRIWMYGKLVLHR